jgi:1-aminocyclopropane-1-carboxylate deaminase/D-cysteine desulfhydrase-like pyridoxal-dependent ACC family enzyme
MPDADFLRSRLPTLASCLPRLSLAQAPTPLHRRSAAFEGRSLPILIKHDDQTGSMYGGNKVRKLEYIFPHAKNRAAVRIATFGAAGSNHALATALYARQAGFDCTCFLSHQAKTPQVAKTLNKHIECGTEIIRYGGPYARRIATLRETLWGRRAWVIPMGGSSWLGTIGFVAAGLEAAQQLRNDADAWPDRLYVAAGTMGTAVGLALGFALAELPIEVQAVRVSDVSIMNQAALDRLLCKTVTMMRRYDPGVPANLAGQAKLRVRDEFFGPGYAKGTPATAEALAFGRAELGLQLETTYTAKAMAALMADWRAGSALTPLYWHTCNSVPLGVSGDQPLDPGALPEEFLRYFGD